MSVITGMSIHAYCISKAVNIHLHRMLMRIPKVTHVISPVCVPYQQHARFAMTPDPAAGTVDVRTLHSGVQNAIDAELTNRGLIPIREDIDENHTREATRIA